MKTLFLLAALASTLGAQERPMVAASPLPARGTQPVARAVTTITRTARVTLWPDGSLRSAAGLRSRPYLGTPESAARRFVDENPAVFGPGVPPDFEPTKTTEILGMKTVRLRQMLDGYPVLGQEVVLNLSGDHAVEGVQARYVSGAIRKGAWNADRERAIAAARAHKTAKPLGEAKAERAWRVDSDSLGPVWVVRFSTEDGDWQILVSADSGKVVETKNLRVGQQIQRQGFAFPTNPAVGDLARVNLVNLTSANRLTGSNTVVLSYFRSVASEGTQSNVEQLASPDNSGVYAFQPPDPRFSEVQAYYTINRAADYFKAIGFPGMPEPLPAIVWFADCEQGKGCQGQFNAFFSPSFLNDKPTVVMYVTPKGGDTSWDSDAVIHEYGHAIVSALVGPDQGETFGALNEGVADYFSCSLLDDPNVGEFFALLAGERSRYLRTVNNDNRFPDSVVGEVHVDGNVWSGALWDVRKLLGREKTDRIALLTMANLSAQAEFFDAASISVEAARRLYGPVDAQAVEQVMRRRGILTDAAEIASKAATLSPDGEPGGGQIAAARQGVTLLAGKQFKFAVPPQVTSFTVEVAADQPVRLLSSFRTPVVVTDGTTNAEYFTEPGRRLQFTVNLDSDPEIQTGTYYVVIGNTATAPVEYALRVLYEGDPEGPALRFTNLDLDATEITGSIPTGPLLGSRLFVLRVPTTATGLAVGVEGDTDVDLFIRAGAPVTINNQGLPEADLELESEDSTEVALITRGTIPALRPGIYTVGVLNYDNTRPAHFRIAAQTTNAPLPRNQVSQLPASVSVAMQKAYGAAQLSERQFTVNIADSAQRLRLAVQSSLDTTIYLRRGREVSVNAEGRVQADFIIRTREQPNVDLLRTSAQALQSGTYYLAVSNSSSQEGTVTINHQVQ